jgi:hypothetical protein
MTHVVQESVQNFVIKTFAGTLSQLSLKHPESDESIVLGY